MGYMKVLTLALFMVFGMVVAAIAVPVIRASAAPAPGAMAWGSDSCPVTVSSGVTMHWTGAHFQGATWAPGEAIRVEVLGQRVGGNVLDASPSTAVNLDVQYGVYDIGAGEVAATTGIAYCHGIGTRSPLVATLGFGGGYGGSSVGYVSNFTFTAQRAESGWMRFEEPIVVTGTCPTTATQCQIGAVFVLHSAETHLVNYSYGMQARIR